MKGLLQVKTFLDFLKCFASVHQSYAVPTLVVTYFVFILAYSYTVLDQYGRVNSCGFKNEMSTKTRWLGSH